MPSVTLYDGTHLGVGFTADEDVIYDAIRGIDNWNVERFTRWQLRELRDMEEPFQIELDYEASEPRSYTNPGHNGHAEAIAVVSDDLGVRLEMDELDAYTRAAVEKAVAEFQPEI